MLKPTTDFRWAMIPLGKVGWDHPSSLRHADKFAQILQQKWEATDAAGGLLSEEWRDIPMVEVKP